jgi:hypothetical protein
VHDEAVPRVPSFIVIGGGEAGAAQVRQLLRAAATGRLETEHIRVVDRDPRCAARSVDDARVQVDTAEWADWLGRHLAAARPEDHLVPYHWAPHLLHEWLAAEARRAGFRTARGGPLGPRGLPFEAETRAGDRALSYAAWTCPPACIEPALCPHTRGPRDWSLAEDLEREGEGEWPHRIVLRCLHLVHGVGTTPVRDVLDARGRLLAGARAGRRRWVVATSSHCHALAGTMELTLA